MDDRDKILAALDAFVRQRPGVDPRNYVSDWRDIEGRRAYHREVRSITRDLHDFRALLAEVAWRSSITAEHLREGFRAYSGRLTLHEKDGKAWCEYCTGQYFPTEYRKAACAVLAAVLWDYFRNCLAETRGDYNGDDVRKEARIALGARLQRRWLD